MLIVWVILPVKHLNNSKTRLSTILSDEQRYQFSLFLFIDTLNTLSVSKNVQGITIISSDQSLIKYSKKYDAELLLTEKDRGYRQDVEIAIAYMNKSKLDKIAVIPIDLPQLSQTDLELLDRFHKKGISLCPSEKDGGTNILMFTLPITIPVLFGNNSFIKHKIAAKNRHTFVRIIRTEGACHDIDRPDDLQWLGQQKNGGKAWKFIKDMKINANIMAI